MKAKDVFKEGGLLSGKKILTLTIIAVVISITTIPVLAASSDITVSEGKWINKESKGRIEYRDSKTSNIIIVDSTDLDTLAVQADNINTAITNLGLDPSTIGSSSVNAGEVVLNPDGTIKAMSGTKVDFTPNTTTFSGMLASSVNVDCSEADITEENITAGKKAYDAYGNLITGSGVDNDTNYTNGYNIGLSEGIRKGLASSNIVIKAHIHAKNNGDETIKEFSSQREYEQYLENNPNEAELNSECGCYTDEIKRTSNVWVGCTCGGSGAHWEGNGSGERGMYGCTEQWLVCDGCGHGDHRGRSCSSGYYNTVNTITYKPSCGYNNGQIVSIEIIPDN